MKKLSKDEMKNVIGGLEGGNSCTASCNCSGGGTVSCSGTNCTVTWGNEQHTYCTGVSCGTDGSGSCS